MKEFTKAVLYAYPTIDEMKKAYAEHIRNKAILSHRHFGPAGDLIGYVVGQIGKRDKLVWLESVLNEVMAKLNDTERALLRMRYFRKRKAQDGAAGTIAKWSESTYFRMQKKLERRVESMLIAKGLTEQVFDEWFADMEIFRYIAKRLQAKKEGLNAYENATLR